MLKKEIMIIGLEIWNELRDISFLNSRKTRRKSLRSVQGIDGVAFVERNFTKLWHQKDPVSNENLMNVFQ